MRPTSFRGNAVKERGKTIIRRNYRGDFSRKSTSSQRAVQGEEGEV